MHIYRQRDDIPKIVQRFWPFTLLGTFQALLFTAKVFAFSYGPTSYVLAVMASSFLFTALIGMLFMKERVSSKKVFSLCLLVVGIMFITMVS